MHVISFVTAKGGSGKSTTAASIAVAAMQDAQRVFVLELDRQGTLSDWIESRQSESGPEFERIDATDRQNVKSGRTRKSAVTARRQSKFCHPAAQVLSSDGDRGVRQKASHVVSG